MKRSTLMKESEYKAFVEDTIGTVRGAKGAETTLMDVLKKHGLEMSLPEAMADKLAPLLNAKVGEQRSIAHNCAVCDVCGVCLVCEEVNAASIGAHTAATMHILDSR